MVWLLIAVASFFGFLFVIDWSLWASIPVGLVVAVVVPVLIDVLLTEFKSKFARR